MNVVVTGAAGFLGRILVSRILCECSNAADRFTLVDRGKGLDAAKAERALAASGEERQGSNIGKGQMKAADYVLVPDIANRNRNSGGTNVGGTQVFPGTRKNAQQ